MSKDPDAIDPHNNPESRAAEESASPGAARSSSGGALPADAVPGQAGTQDGDAGSGTSGGDPLDGVLIDPADAEQAVPGDEGPEHPGQR